MSQNRILLFSLFVLTQLNIHQINCAHAALRRAATATTRTLSARAGRRALSSSSSQEQSQQTFFTPRQLQRLATLGLCTGVAAWNKDTLVEKLNRNGIKFLPRLVLVPLAILVFPDMALNHETQRTALHDAAINGDEELAACCINRKAHLESTDADGVTPLYWALSFEHIATAEMLLKAGACSSNLRTKEGNSPLHLILSQPNVNIKKLRTLLEWQACRNYRELEINAQNNEGYSPLNLALIRRNDAKEEADKWLRIIKLLLKHGADPFSKNKYHNSPYDSAYLIGDKELLTMFKQLQEQQGNMELDEVDRDVFTSLHKAASEGSEEAARTLVEKEYVLDAKNDATFSALFIALLRGHTGVAEILLEGGAKNIKTSIGNATHCMRCLATQKK